MIKAELLKMGKLYATPSMLQSAKDDVLEKHQWHYGPGYHYGRYLRCVAEGDVLKIAFFLAEHLKAGGKLPAYEVYIDRKREQFITFDCFNKKWLTAKLDLIHWDPYVRNSCENWISDKHHALIKKFLSTKQGGYPGILEYQLKVRADELKRWHKRQTDPWDLELSQTKPLPKDWENWVKKVGIPHYYLFYHYKKGGAKTAYCSYCEKEVPIKNPRHNKQGRCPVCRHQATFKAVGRMGSFYSEDVPVYLIQRCDSGFMIREFLAHNFYLRGRYLQPGYYAREIRRAFYDENAKPVSAYYWGDYKHRETRWIKTSVCSPTGWSWENGMIYGKSLPALFRQELKNTGLQEFIQRKKATDPERYLANYEQVPKLEQMEKAGLYILVDQCLNNCYPYKDLFGSSSSASLIKALEIDAPRLQRLRDSKRGLEFLQWLRFEKQHNQQIGDMVIHWLCQEGISPHALSFISKKMHINQIYNYILRQMMQQHECSGWVLRTWQDHLNMAGRLGLNTDDCYVFRPAKLKEQHQKLVDRMNQEGDEEKVIQLRKQFPKVERICASIQSLYSYRSEQYQIVVPKGILDIVLEGRHLNHCVGSSTRYLDRIENQESYILFLRKSSNLDGSYYTLEVEPDGTIRQKRTTGDNQNADIEDATEFLKEWQAAIKKRLTPEHKKLAAASKVLREKEFEELRKRNVTVSTGPFRGQLLLDILMADLMETPQEAPQPAMAVAA